LVKAETRFPQKITTNTKDFENSVLDVISEGETSSLFPKDVLERGAKRYAKEVFQKI
jgi:hypothetical protein